MTRKRTIRDGSHRPVGDVGGVPHFFVDAAGVDYVNFRWYSEDAKAQAEVKRYLEEATGLPAVCNEMGQQKNTSPEQVTKMLAKSLEIGLPVVVRYSVDTPGYGEAKGLTGPRPGASFSH